MFNWAMIGQFQFFCLSSLRLSLQHLSSLLMFPLQELVDGFSLIKVKVGACLIRKKLFNLSIKSLAKICFPTSSNCKPSQKTWCGDVIIVNENKWVVSAHVRNALVYTWNVSTCQFVVNNSRDQNPFNSSWFTL